jgi:hypothetical protein
MSSTQDLSLYEFAGGYSDPDVQGSFDFRITQRPGFGDAEAFALKDALAAAFPPVLSANIQVLKSRAVTTNYDTNDTADPPSFT